MAEKRGQLCCDEQGGASDRWQARCCETGVRGDAAINIMMRLEKGSRYIVGD